MKTEIIFLFVLLLFGCDKKMKSPQDLEGIFINKDKIIQIKQAKFDEPMFIDSCSFIPLETTDASLIGEIKQIEMYNNKLYIYDRKTDAIKVFDEKGKYLCNIGRKGEGAEEYLSIKSFYINADEKKVCILDPLRKTVHEFDMEGKYIQGVKLAKWGFYYMSNLMYFDKYLYGFFDVLDDSDDVYAKISVEDYSIVDKWSTYPVKENDRIPVSFLKHPLSITKTGIHYISLYSDTIYTYKDGETAPYLIIETGKPNIPSDFFKGKTYEYEPSKAYVEVGLSKKYSPGFDRILETERFLFVRFDMKGDFYAVDKETKEAYHINKPFSFDFDFMRSEYVSGDVFIRVLEQSRVSYCQRDMKGAENEFPEQMKNVILNYNPDDDNPIILIYHIKK